MIGQDALYVMQDLGAFDIKGKGVQTVYAARVAPLLALDSGQGDVQLSAATHLEEINSAACRGTIRAHAVSHSNLGSDSTSSTDTSSTALHPMSWKSASSRSWKSASSRTSEKSFKRWCEVKQSDQNVLGNVTGEWRYKLPGGLTLVLPSGSFMQQQVQKLAWSKSSLTLRHRSQQAISLNLLYFYFYLTLVFAPGDRWRKLVCKCAVSFAEECPDIFFMRLCEQKIPLFLFHF